MTIARPGLALLALGLFFAACASGGGDDVSASSTARPDATSRYSNAPAGTRLAKIQFGMNDTEVRQILGNPSNSKSYMTGKAFIPFYYFWGGDSHRSDWIYRGQGRVVFSRSPRNGAMKVIRVMYNPNE